MSIKIPNNNQYVQTNKSDIFGNIQGSFGLDLTSKLGELGVTRTLQTTSQANGGAPQSTLTSYPVGFVVHNDGSSTKIWTAVGLSGTGKPHASASAVANAGFVVDATTGVPTDCDSTLSDISLITFSGGSSPTLCVTANSKLYVRTTGNWTSTAITAGGGPWMMTGFGGRLYMTISGVSKIISTVDGTTMIAPSNTYALQLDLNFIPTVMRGASNRIWIGTIAKTGKGYVYEWDGSQTQVTRGYRLEAQGCLAMVIKDGMPWLIDSNGKLLTYSNGTFIEKARLPIDSKFLLRATNSVNNRFIHPNGMTIVDGRINILINNVLDDNGSSIPEFCPSGVWEYDDNIGLYHKHALSYTLTTTNTITDYGQNRVSGVGAISEMKLTNSATNATGNLVIGAVVYTNASATDSGIWTNDTFDAVSGTTGQYNTQGGGYVVTTKILSANIKDTFNKLFSFHKKYATSSDKMKIEYRQTEATPTEASITWTSTTTFTTTTDVLALVGYEVEGIQGTGSGQTAHITTVSVNGGTYTVTVDDAFTGVTSGTAKVRIQNWTLAGTFSTQTDEIFDTNLSELASFWIELKVTFIWARKNKLFGLLLTNKPNQLIN